MITRHSEPEPEVLGRGNPQADAELAAEARAGGRLMRTAWFRRCIPEAQREAAIVTAGASFYPRGRPTMLPEAAFDWPIYRAALQER